MKKLLISVAVFAFAIASFAQAPGYEFTTVVSHKATPVKDQSSTGTCWCFATASFMESELLRMGKGEYDLSEMFIVRQKYMNQMEDNYLRNIMHLSIICSIRIWVNCRRNSLIKERNIHRSLSPKAWD